MVDKKTQNRQVQEQEKENKVLFGKFVQRHK